MHATINLLSELQFKTSRSGGAGGQSVNKVESAVEACWLVSDSVLVSEEKKALIFEKLGNRINKEGLLCVRSQVHRTQLANKAEATQRINQLVQNALEKKRARIATKPSGLSREKRLDQKKKQGDKKLNRRVKDWLM